MRRKRPADTGHRARDGQRGQLAGEGPDAEVGGTLTVAADGTPAGPRTDRDEDRGDRGDRGRHTKEQVEIPGRGEHRGAGLAERDGKRGHRQTGLGAGQVGQRLHRRSAGEREQQGGHQERRTLQPPADHRAQRPAGRGGSGARQDADRDGDTVRGQESTDVCGHA